MKKIILAVLCISAFCFIGGDVLSTSFNTAEYQPLGSYTAEYQPLYVYTLPA